MSDSISKDEIIEKLEKKLELKNQEIGRLKEQLDNLEKENSKLLSIIVIRGDLEGVEEEMALTFGFPAKNVMIQELKDQKEWHSNVHTTHKLNHIGLIHFVKWLYYITFSGEELAKSINAFLTKHGVKTITFCEFVAKIYMKTSHLIHQCKPNKVISSEDLLNGLKMYGIDNGASLETIDVLSEIKKLPLSRKHSTVSTLASSCMSSPSDYAKTFATPFSSASFRKPNNRRHNQPRNHGNRKYIPYAKRGSLSHLNKYYQHQPYSNNSWLSTSTIFE